MARSGRSSSPGPSASWRAPMSSEWWSSSATSTSARINACAMNPLCSAQWTAPPTGMLTHGWRNVLVEINNECNVKYDHAILKPARVPELIERVQRRSDDGGRAPARQHLLRRRDRPETRRGASGGFPAAPRQRREGARPKRARWSARRGPFPGTRRSRSFSTRTTTSISKSRPITSWPPSASTPRGATSTIVEERGSPPRVSKACRWIGPSPATESASSSDSSVRSPAAPLRLRKPGLAPHIPTSRRSPR